MRLKGLRLMKYGMRSGPYPDKCDCCRTMSQAQLKVAVRRFVRNLENRATAKELKIFLDTEERLG